MNNYAWTLIIWWKKNFVNETNVTSGNAFIDNLFALGSEKE